MKRNFEWKETSSPLCPLCKKEVETCDHVLQCPSTFTRTIVRAELQEFHASLVKMQTQPILRKHMMRVLKQWFLSYSIPKINIAHVQEMNIGIAEAINDQITIGIDNLVRGVISWKIGIVQQQFYDTVSKKMNGDGQMWARRVIDSLLSMTHRIWKQRCELVNNTLEMSYEKRLRN